MPYITFSRKFDRGSAKRLLKTIVSKDSIVELRGTKTIRRIAEKANSKGFKSALIIDEMDEKAGKLRARELKVVLKDGKAAWKFGRKIPLVIK